MKIGINKRTLAKKAKIIPEMYSYLLRMGRQGNPLPEACLGKVTRALIELEEAR